MASEQDSQAKKAGESEGEEALKTMHIDSGAQPTMQFAGGQPTMKFSAAAQNTMPVAPKTMPQPVSGSGSGKPISSMAAANKTHIPGISSEIGPESLSVGIQVHDLTGERLLLAAPRTESHGRICPTLGGIPLLTKIGQGGMGAVYFGIHPRLRSEVAVKVLPFHLAEQDPAMIRRFYREAQIAAQVRSPHLVNVMDVNEESGLFYLVMEYVSGGTAGHYMKSLIEKGQQGVPEREALDIIIAATEGLWAAHANNIIHRDIKPENIIIPYLTKGGTAYDLKRAKLMDLGLARSEDPNQQSLTGAQSAMGTPGYMAPEQAMDAKSADKRSDIFSMGATLYALLTGKPPFKGETVMKVLMATMHEPHEPIKKVRPDISDAVNETLERCLAKKQEHRYPDAKQLLNVLQDCEALLTGGAGTGALSRAGATIHLAGGPASTTMPQHTATITAGPAPATGAKKGLIYGGAAAAVLLISVAGAMIFGGKKPAEQTGAVKKADATDGDKTAVAPKLDKTDLERLTKRHTKLINEALESIKTKDIDDAKLSLEMATKLNLTDQAAKEREQQVTDALKKVEDLKEFTKIIKDVDNLIATGKADNLKEAGDKLDVATKYAADDAASAQLDKRTKQIKDLLGAALKEAKIPGLLAEIEALKKDKPGDAIEKINELLKAIPDEKDPRRVNYLVQQKQLEQAVETAKKYEAAIKEVATAFEAGNFDDANDKALAANILLPTRPEANEWLKKISPKLNEAKKKAAEEATQKQLKENLSKALALADQQIKDKQYDAALDAIKTALQLDPQNAGAATLKTQVETAIADQKKAQELQQKQEKFQTLLTAVNLLVADPDASLDDASKKLAEAKTLFPDDADKKVAVLDAENKVAARQKVLAAKPEYDELLKKARDAQTNGDLAKATELLEKALLSPAKDARAESLSKRILKDIAEAEAAKQKENETNKAYTDRLTKADNLVKDGDALAADALDEKLANYKSALDEYAEAKKVKPGPEVDKLEIALNQKISDINKAKLAAADAAKKKQEADTKAKQDLAQKQEKFDAQLKLADKAAQQGDYVGALRALDNAQTILPGDPALAAKAAQYKKLQTDCDNAITAAFSTAADAAKKSPADLRGAISALQKACDAYPSRKEAASALDALLIAQKVDDLAKQSAAAAGTKLTDYAGEKKLQGKPELAQLSAARDRMQSLASAAFAKTAAANFKDAAAVAQQLSQDQRELGGQINQLILALETLRKEKVQTTSPVGEQNVFDQDTNKSKPKPPPDKPVKKPKGGSVGEQDVFDQ